MPKRKTTTKDQVITALKKRFTTVPELVKECGISKVHARSIIYGLGRKVRRQPISDAAFTAYKLR